MKQLQFEVFDAFDGYMLMATSSNAAGYTVEFDELSNGTYKVIAYVLDNPEACRKDIFKLTFADVSKKQQAINDAIAECNAYNMQLAHRILKEWLAEDVQLLLELITS